MKKGKTIRAAMVIAALAVGSASASVISIQFNENAGNQNFVNGDSIGPLGTVSTNWNDTQYRDSGTLAAGTMSGLIDDTGTATAASLTWSSANTWWNFDGTADEQHMLGTGYLDDGAGGVLITVNNIPYAQYRVYGLFASDAAGSVTDGSTLTSVDFQVNGTWAYGGAAAATATVHGSIEDNNFANGTYWTEIDPGVVAGNYWTVETSGSTLTIDGLERNDTERGSLAGVVIEQIPEPATLGMVALFGGGILFIRRKFTI